MDYRVLKEKVNKYFEETPLEKQTPPGLILYLGVSKKTYNNFYNDNSTKKVMEFVDLKFEEKYWLMLQKPGSNNIKYIMENMYGYAQKNTDDKEILTAEQILIGKKIKA